MASFEMVKSHQSLENARLGEKGPNKSTVVAIGIWMGRQKVHPFRNQPLGKERNPNIQTQNSL